MVNFYHQHNLDGVLFLRDCNARHCLWGDSIGNPNGYLLLESLSADDNILNNGEAIFLSSDASSVIDLCIVSGRIATKVGFELTTDPNIEPFTGAPQRGQIPLLVKYNLSRTTEKIPNRGCKKQTGKPGRTCSKNLRMHQLRQFNAQAP